ncbi:MAG: dTDP-4-dehydrorhamnose 3,5-epimerase [Pelagibacteraceae bacterium TMED124]|nr:MAG: dTDP-4-dehydrorhamnose 3,5-epimerase [Pelagibacteraceae bacterium TMED124]|tara:strand:- start:3946 stop:4536 length:591 start_codon:yes stop_codon:yes gene_type:complete
METTVIISNKNIEMEGPLVIKPSVFKDNRGFFYESWNQSTFQRLIKKNIHFYQDNHSRSTKGVLRGLHYQLNPKGQGKLVRCSSGKIFDVIVDLRKSSKSFLQWFGIELSSENHFQLWIPIGFAHGFITLTDKADVQYKTSQYWSKDHERSLIWNDPKIGITWPLKEYLIKKPILNEKDSLAMSIKQNDENHNLFL